VPYRRESRSASIPPIGALLSDDLWDGVEHRTADSKLDVSPGQEVHAAEPGAIGRLQIVDRGQKKLLRGLLEIASSAPGPDERNED
jgi:hypothetical protein